MYFNRLGLEIAWGVAVGVREEYASNQGILWGKGVMGVKGFIKLVVEETVLGGKA